MHGMAIFIIADVSYIYCGRIEMNAVLASSFDSNWDTMITRPTNAA